MKRHHAFAALAAWAALACSTGYAQGTPVGLWHTIDDETGKPRAEVRIENRAGTLVGTVVRSLVPANPDDELNCSKCTDERKDKPKLGMEIIRGAKPGSEPAVWEGGTILDPNSGKVYRLRLMMLGEKQLQVRGYVGPFYRTQVWHRAQ